MRDRLRFYLKHAFRSLQRERRRSLFAAFAVAAGVAAIVGLQSLSLAIGDSVTDDIQATHQADVVVSHHRNPFRPEQRAVEVIDYRSGVRGGVQKEGVGTGAPLNTPQSPLTSE